MLNKVLSLLLFLSTLLFIILVTALPVNNPDIWYHLKTGEYILNNKTIPKKDFFSFTAAGREWIAQWWFYDVIVFSLQSRFGFNSLIYLKVAIGILIFFILYKTLKLYRLPNTLIFPLLVLTAWIVGTAWVDRPHIFSYLFTAVLMWLLISYQFGKKRPLFLIPPLFLIWANMHASIPIALALIGFLIISETWEKISKLEVSREPEHPEVEQSSLQGRPEPNSVPVHGRSSIHGYHEPIFNLVHGRSWKLEVGKEVRSEKLDHRRKNPISNFQFHNLTSKFQHLTSPLGKTLPLDLVATLFLGATASLINPNTYKTHLYVFKINPEFVSQNIVEWLPLSSFFEDLHTRLFLVFGLLTLMSFFFALLNPPKSKRFRVFRVSLFEILLIASLSYLSLSALRFTPVFVLIILPFMAKNLWLMINDLWRKATRWPRHFSWSMIKKKWPHQSSIINHQSLLIKLALVLAILALCFFHEKRFGGHHLGVEAGALPVAAVEFIDQAELAPPMYHVFNWGGYLMWRLYPKYKVFIDGRLDMYVPDIYDEWLDVVLAKENWKEILEKYKINFCLVSSESEWNRLDQTLETDPDWVLIYWDNKTGIFLKNEPKNQELLEKYGMDSVSIYHPTTPFKPGKEKEAEKEYRRFLELYPKSASAYNKLGVLYFLTNEGEKAEKELRKAIELDPSYATAYFNLGLILEEKGDHNEALGFYQKAKKFAPLFPDIYKKLGYVYSQRLRYQEEAVWHLKKYLELNPSAPDRREVEAEIQKNAQE